MIRDATHQDVPRLVELGRLMHAESNFADLDYDADKTALFTQYLIDAPDCLVAVYAREGEVLGFVAAMSFPAWFGHDQIVNDLALYVHPEVRSTIGGVLLAKRLKQWAIGIGARQVRVGTSAGEAGRGADQIYQYLGFEPTGRCWLYDIKGHAAQPMFGKRLQA